LFQAPIAGNTKINVTARCTPKIFPFDSAISSGALKHWNTISAGEYARGKFSPDGFENRHTGSWNSNSTSMIQTIEPSISDAAVTEIRNAADRNTITMNL